MPRKNEAQNLSFFCLLPVCIILFSGINVSATSAASEPMTGFDDPMVDTSAQILPNINEAAGDTAGPDSVILDPTLYRPEGDTLLLGVYRERQAAEGKKKSPTLTMLKSVVFPGWGQFSNGRYIKGVIILGAESYFIYKAVDHGQKAEDWRRKWREAPPELKNEYFEKYADYRDRRNSHIWYTALTIFLSMFDAYVDAHLQNFPEDIPKTEGLSLDLAPGEDLRLLVRYDF